MSSEDNADNLLINEQEEEKTKGKYDYPVNIFKRIIFAWKKRY